MNHYIKLCYVIIKIDYYGTGDVVSTTMSNELNIDMTMNITDSSSNSIVNIGKDKNLLDVITGNNPNYYAWQDIHSNRSHIYELP